MFAFFHHAARPQGFFGHRFFSVDLALGRRLFKVARREFSVILGKGVMESAFRQSAVKGHLPAFETQKGNAAP